MKIALASPRPATSIDDGLGTVERSIGEAADRGARIVCFPEAYVPGLRGQDFDVPPYDRADEERVLHDVSRWARAQAVAVVMGMERLTTAGRQIAAAVFGPDGQFLGWQTKNQLDPSEDRFYVPGETRQLFEVDGVKFGIAICHEGWRYPETVRWAAVRGAQIVFHPQLTGAERSGNVLTSWGSPDAPYYEKAMMCRALENTIWFASVNYGLAFQESATSIIDPDGTCVAHLPYNSPGVLVQDVDLSRATGLLARRFAADRYGSTAPS